MELLAEVRTKKKTRTNAYLVTCFFNEIFHKNSSICLPSKSLRSLSLSGSDWQALRQNSTDKLCVSVYLYALGLIRLHLNIFLMLHPLPISPSICGIHMRPNRRSLRQK